MIPAAQPAPMPTPAARPEDEPLDLVFLEGFTGHTVIGIHPNELGIAQPVVIDVCAGLPRVRACASDRIGDTLDYGELRERLRRLLSEHGVQLLEALAERVARIALDEFGAAWVRVRVVKPRKFEDTDAVGVQIERRRETSPPGPARATLTLIGAGLVPGSRLGRAE